MQLLPPQTELIIALAHKIAVFLCYLIYAVRQKPRSSSRFLLLSKLPCLNTDMSYPFFLFICIFQAFTIPLVQCFCVLWFHILQHLYTTASRLFMTQTSRFGSQLIQKASEVSIAKSFLNFFPDHQDHWQSNTHSLAFSSAISPSSNLYVCVCMYI